MTVALCVKINDGIVLAADSASSIFTGSGGIQNVYNNANKIFNLKKGYPLGVVSWGLGGIGDTTIESLMKYFREKADEEFGVDWNNYTIKDVADKLRKYLLEDKYQKLYKKDGPAIGMYVTGYSSNEDKPEIWTLGKAPEENDFFGPELVYSKKDYGIVAGAIDDIVTRLVQGINPDFLNYVLREKGVEDSVRASIIDEISRRYHNDLVHPAMPIQDAIDLSVFLVEATIKAIRFGPGAPVVGGPVEVSAITRYEGFRWINRKHYYDVSFNRFEE